MSLNELLLNTRSFRRFDEAKDVPIEDLKKAVKNARLTPSAANLQAVRFILSTNRDSNELIFPHLNWAAYLKNWPGPGPGERPSAYIILLGDRNISTYVDWDYGIIIQTILLSLTEMGWGACTIVAYAKEAVRKALNINAKYQMSAIIAIGKAAETVVVDPAIAGDIRYWRDDADVHHVPKRSLEELVYRIIT